uniref:Uncharacterized protein n=1 Tax=Paenibacillus athensensis TaxID=1967502 RepID=A0A4Y8Q600_9BACL
MSWARAVRSVGALAARAAIGRPGCAASPLTPLGCAASPLTPPAAPPALAPAAPPDLGALNAAAKSPSAASPRAALHRRPRPLPRRPCAARRR